MMNHFRVIDVKKKDLPLSCPQKSKVVWNSHPRVFLSLSEKTPVVACPYCGTRYQLISDKQE